MRPDRHIRLHNSNNQMWESNNSPPSEAISNCNVVQCCAFNLKIGFFYLFSSVRELVFIDYSF